MSHSTAIAHSKDYSLHQETTPQTFTGNQGLFMEEALIFEQNTPDLTGVDWPDVEVQYTYLADLRRHSIDLPGLSEPQVVRHYTRLSQKNYSIDAGFYPLGSCTMKHNPRLNEKVARMFSDIHPLQPISTVQGALAVIHQLSDWLTKLTGMPAVAMTPAAGAHGEVWINDYKGCPTGTRRRSAFACSCARISARNQPSNCSRMRIFRSIDSSQ